jgi:hypothetical protein
METVGHDVPQPVAELKVRNATQRDVIIETVLPMIVELRSELRLQLDQALERIRCLEMQMPNKVDKEFLEAFFRKMRMAVQETNEKVASLQTTIAERLAKDEIDEQNEAPRLSESAAGGKTAVTCLVCGSKRPVTVASGTGVTKRGRVYRGRTPVGYSIHPDYDDARLPPLRVGE